MMRSETTCRTLAAGLALAALTAAAAPAEQVIKSPADDRAYRAMVLDNGLRVLLVSDPGTDKAAASLDVHVGNGSDPADRAGLAHFLEHMLFLGTDRYPDPGEYKNFISIHGGSDNAYTSFDHTNYFFDINHGQLEPALDRFSRFFAAPRFNPEYVARERQVVHSEFVSKLKSDGRRGWYAFKQALNPDHPASRFAVGANDTLDDRPGRPVRDDLLEFYDRHYSAGLMSLAVLGREPLDELERMVRARFSEIPNGAAGPLAIDQPLFAPGTLPRRLEVEPVRDIRRATFSFAVPPLREHWQAKPTRYLADLIGHEGEGSLLAALKAAGWAEGLGTGTGYDHADAATFNVSIQLTEKGLSEIQAIGEMLFAYLDLIRAAEVERWRFDELKGIADLHFRFDEKARPLPYVRALASALHDYPAADVLRGRFAMDRYDPDLVRAYLQRLRPDNLLLSVTARGLPADSETDRYGVRYRLGPLPEAMLAAWSDPSRDERLALPRANPFIPQNLALVEGGEVHPVPTPIERSPGLELWHQRDTTFGLPLTDYFFSVRSPVANDTPRHAVLTSMYVAMVNDLLSEYSYPADLAGMSYSLYKHMRGFTLRMSSYSDKERMLLERVVATLAEPELRPERFDTLKEEMARRLRNADKRAPFRRSLGEVRQLLLVPTWSDEALLEALASVTMEELRAFLPKLLGGIHVVVLAHGNLTPDKARALTALVRGALVDPASPVEVASGTVIRLDPGDRFLRELETEHQDSAVAIYYQGPDRSFEARARAGLLAEIVSSSFFDELRTERKLGYIVFANRMSLLEVPGLAFLVQSPTAPPDEVIPEIEDFIARQVAAIEAMDRDTFARHQASLVSKILEAETRLTNRTDRYWTEIDRDHHEFDSRGRLVEAVRATTLEDLVAFYRDTLLGAGSRRLVVSAPSPAHGGPRGEERASESRSPTRITDDGSFKASKAVFEVEGR